MSAYFQRLLNQSGVQFPPASGPVAPVQPSALFARPPQGTSIASDLIEVHHEQEARPAPPSSPSRTPPESVPFSSRQPAPQNAELPAPSTPAPSFSPDPQHERIVIHETNTRIEETVAVGPFPFPANLPPLVSAPSETSSPAVVAVANPAAPPPSGPELPAEIMQAVMKWIAAGSSSGNQTAQLGREPPSPTAKAPAPSSVAPTPARPVAPQPSNIPDRMIHIVEKHFEEATALNRSAAAAPFAQPAPTFVSPPESPVRVSIGSIHVRVDAPAPAPVRFVRPAAPPPPAAPLPRSSGISQLRRHYIIPH